MNLAGYEFSEPQESIKSLPSSKAVYAIISDGNVIYVGATSRLYSRICEHKCRKMKGLNFTVSFFECENIFSVERDVIQELRPMLNHADNPAKAVEVKKQVVMTMKPSVKSAGARLASDVGVSLSGLVSACLVKAVEEHEFIAECAEREGLTPLEAEIKFRSEWGLA